MPNIYNFVSDGSLYAIFNLSLQSPKSTNVKFGYLFINSSMSSSAG